MTTARTPIGMPCVVTHSRSSSASWMSSESRRTFWRPGTTNAPLPTTILNPRPAASPSGPWCARRPEMIRASFGSATLYMSIGADAPSSDGASGEPADDDGARRVLLEHDDARALLDPLGLVGGVGVVGLVAPSDGDHDLAHPSGLDRADDAPDLADELVVDDHPRPHDRSASPKNVSLEPHSVDRSFQTDVRAKPARPDSRHRRVGALDEARGGGVEGLWRDPGHDKVAADASVAALEFLEHAHHGLRRRARHAEAPLALGLVLGFGDPLPRPLDEVGVALAVVGGDVVEPDAGEPQEQRDDEARSVPPA